MCNVLAGIGRGQLRVLAERVHRKREIFESYRSLLRDLPGIDFMPEAPWKPMHIQPVFKDCEAVGGAVAEELFRDGLCLPSGTAMTDTDLHRVTDIIHSLRK